ncbi:sugar phosphate isomerase/epimerase [Paenibacillus filicis]|uniref:Sugar phosphate isomerase/epimerase n=2 Tax=Paenibacillus gyeongsangnamensis TaxID=3388067 RepID=A0ABT4Q4V9_9BACL|nr:sugar phosphate isomerase/epimerase [Paenibacillus filicis]
MVKITCFADEISKDLSEQLNVLEQEGLKYLELRGVWGKNVLQLDEAELGRVRTELDERGFRVSSIASPIGKYPVTDDFAPQLEALDRAAHAARFFGTPYIRVFSYHLPKEEPAEAYREEVLRRMKRLADEAERQGVILVLENDSNLYGTTDDRCLDIITHCDSKSLRSAFDPGNYVVNGIDPMAEAYPKLAFSVDYVHVKDARDHHFVPAGLGDGSLEQLLGELKSRGYDGFLSVEPHLKHYLPEASDPERVVTAIRALKDLLSRIGQTWE